MASEFGLIMPEIALSWAAAQQTPSARGCEPVHSRRRLAASNLVFARGLCRSLPCSKKTFLNSQGCSRIWAERRCLINQRELFSHLPGVTLRGTHRSRGIETLRYTLQPAVRILREV